MRGWLKELREKNNLTMKEMGEKLSISESYYCAIENGTRQKKMDVTLITGLSLALDVPMTQILELEARHLNVPTT